jgi:hypothetical protein
VPKQGSFSLVTLFLKYEQKEAMEGSLLVWIMAIRSHICGNSNWNALLFLSLFLCCAILLRNKQREADHSLQAYCSRVDHFF